MSNELLRPPNLICIARILASAALVPLAAADRPMAWLVLFVALLFSDGLDGRLARRHGWQTELGSRLDSAADKVLYAAALVSAPWLAPGILRAEWPWIGAALVTYGLAVGFTLWKFRGLPSYHTATSKLTVYLIGAGAVLAFTDVSIWPLRIALAFVALANLETLAITAILDRPTTDVPTVWDALYARRSGRGNEPLPRRRIAEGRDPQAPLRLVQISDLHFGPPFLPRVGEALERAVAKQPTDAVIVSGDVTQRAKREQFEEARAFFDRLGDVPVLVVPGNHDVPLYRVAERLLRPRALYREVLSEELDAAWELPGAVIATLDSTSPRRAISNGRIHLDQLDFVRRAFEGVPPETAKIVVAHHHFAPAPDFEPDQTMPRAKRALDLFVELRVDLVLGGHLHRAYVGNSLDVYPGRDRTHGVIIAQCGTTTSRRGRAKEAEKNSFNAIRIDSETIEITHWLYAEEEGEFRPSSRHLFPRPLRRYLADAGGRPRAARAVSEAELETPARSVRSAGDGPP